eukprot:gnl/TRDRNA2_/TRDRNA2_179924_c0_seq1.p1 gnl/TRDRNA2_/TRDRNA2_179924_c0~~gnl/TRDRNA2_/TRDRNA2_179924_c0_seq1.p1  ORF type:complete len:377 (-),score=65.45 gnl/TRDRNA2_/TRDRNA2_179924_c0_seq1:56-1120(-)
MATATSPVLARVLVTGGQGFIGSYVIRDLLRHGAEVALFELKDMPHIQQQVLRPEEIKRIHQVFADITDGAAVKKCVMDFKPTAVIHLAGMQIPAVKGNPVLGASVNVNGTINIFEAVRALAAETNTAPAPVIYASSAAVLGPQNDYPPRPVLAEGEYHKPRTLYGVLKLCNEGTARIYWQDYSIPSVAMRPLTVFGVGREVGLTSGPTKAVKAAVLGRRFEIQVTGVTGFQYVGDVARHFVEAAPACAKKGGAHVCGMKGHLCSYEDFLREAARALPAVGQLASIVKDAPEVLIAGDVDEAPLESLLGTSKLHSSLSDAVADMVKHFQELQKQGKLSDSDLGPAPGTAPSSKL